MNGLRDVGCVVVVAAGAILAGRPAMADATVLFASPEIPGAQHPAAGRSLFDELFGTPSGYDIPFPFARLIDALNARIAPERVRTALIPLGRSLQRYAADPHYFDSPRLVVAVTADGADADRPAAAPRLKDRLFLGYQPAAEAIEVISYNESAGRFEFQEITDYGPGQSPEVGYAARELCVGCHQAHAPIFSRPLWGESNANPEVAEKLSALGPQYNGAAVRQGIDALDDFDQSTDRANEVVAVNHLWDRGCGAGAAGIDCRAALLKAALHYRLTGSRADWAPSYPSAAVERLLQTMTSLWSGGLGAPDPDLPSADPVVEMASGRSIGEILEPDGARNPQTRRPARLYWAPSEDARSNFTALARNVAMLFSTADVAWLDGHIRGRAGSTTTFEASCDIDRLSRGDELTELRFACGGGGAALSLAGFAVLNGAEVTAGRVDRLSVRELPPIRRLRIVGGEATQDGATASIRFEIRDDSAGISPRLLSGERIAAFRLRDDRVAEIGVVADLDVLDAAIDALAGADDAPLDAGPLRRRAVLAGLAQALQNQ